MKFNGKNTHGSIFLVIVLGIVGLAFACKVRLQESGALADGGVRGMCSINFASKDGFYSFSGMDLNSCPEIKYPKELPAKGELNFYIFEMNQHGYRLETCLPVKQDFSWMTCVWYQA